ncbi:MAG: ADP-ribosylation factor-like protein [Candidatus Hydrothermia bacterium]|jgi:signal recognition particle receptor subunit beta|nr:ADP-ribosylation factor-like protein [Candidatus Hydrothermia bacterium]
MLLNKAKNEIDLKIVYYGPALAGKTENLKYIYSKISPERRGELVKIDTKGERTLYFDFMPIEIKLEPYKLKVHLFSVPGQVFYKVSRKLVLKGFDGIIFVADSSPDRREANIQSMEEMLSNIQSDGLKIEDIPIVLQYNKRDLTNALPIEVLQNDLNRNNWQYVLAVASEGKGVIETLDLCLKLTIKSVKAKII